MYNWRVKVMKLFDNAEVYKKPDDNNEAGKDLKRN